MVPASKRQKLSNNLLSDIIMSAQDHGEFDWPKISPDGVGDYIESLGRSVNSSGENMLMGLLAIIPGLIGSGGQLEVRKNYAEPASLFSISLADPGAGKSPAHSLLTRELCKANLSHLIIDRYTQNGLFDHMMNNDGVAIMFDAEMGMFLENVLKKQSEGTGERQLLCKLYDCTAWSKVSGNQDRMEIPHPVPVIGGYSQPDTFIKTFIQLMERNDGFPDRFLLETPKPISLHEEEIDEWEEVLSTSYSHVRLAETFEFIYKIHNSGEQKTYLMSKEALLSYRSFSNDISDRLNELWKNRSNQSARISKDKRTALRLALNLHILYSTLSNIIDEKRPKITSDISKDTMEMAISLTQHFSKQREIYEQVSGV